LAEICKVFKEFCKMLKTQFGVEIKRLKTDGGGEFKLLKKYLKQKGIKHETSAPYSPNQNSVAE
jgi:hypothetical protein